MSVESDREKALDTYQAKLLEHREVEAQLRECESLILAPKNFSSIFVTFSANEVEGEDSGARQDRRNAQVVPERWTNHWGNSAKTDR